MRNDQCIETNTVSHHTQMRQEKKPYNNTVKVIVGRIDSVEHESSKESINMFVVRESLVFGQHMATEEDPEWGQCQCRNGLVSCSLVSLE